MKLLGSDWIPEFPLEADPFAFGIAIDTFLVATKLRIITRQQHETSKNSGSEFVEKIGIAIVAIDLPMRRNRAEIHNAGMPAWRLCDGRVWH
jgi:hypothetical protein